MSDNLQTIENLVEHGIPADIDRDPANRSGGDQLYFNDPDGIRMQLAQHGYPGQGPSQAGGSGG